MLLALLFSSFAQVQQPPVGRPVQQRRAIVVDSSADTTADSTRARRRARRAPVTAELLATAFRDATTRSIVEAARHTRIAQDSTLRNYDATTRERISVDLGIGAVGREHLVYRQEVAARVRWQRDIGVWIDMTGARVGIPMAPREAEIDGLLGDIRGMSPIPYFPGLDELWIGGNSEVARVDANERDIVNPLAVGSEAYYTFAIGDSISYTLPDGSRISLREVEVRPRTPSWNLAVGSLWFDGHGQLVKAAYRLSTPIDLWQVASEEGDGDKPPKLVQGFLSPLKAQITGIAIEYSLHGTHWLPRMRSMEGRADILFAKVPLQIDQRFAYASINGPDDLQPMDTRRLPPITTPVRRDSVRKAARDSARVVARAGGPAHDAHMKAAADSLARGLPVTGLSPGSQAARDCDTSHFYVTYTRRYDSRLPVAIRIPCDLNTLTRSPDLPPSIYDSGDQLFDTKDRDAMLAAALGMAAQAPITLQTLPPMSLTWGFPMTRYNRIEGLSTGVGVEQQIGEGLSVGGSARFGFADRDPAVELFASRTNLAVTLRASGYHRLVSASDWGSPLTFGSSFGALFLGHDDGFYYRATGGDLTWTRGSLSRVEWRLFAEDQRTATVETNFSVAHRAESDSFPSNLTAAEGTWIGGGLHLVHNHGLDPRGFRTFTDVRVEAARGDSAYGRAAADFTMSRGLLFSTAGSLTLAGGSAVGALPPQRLWYLGGTQTVRGQSADIAQSGNAFWLTRLELAHDARTHRSSLFGDLGWAGDRNSIRRAAGKLSGVGYGESMFDGLLRVDLARGLAPRRQWRFDLYLEARF